jgi:hypothetical protein
MKKIDVSTVLAGQKLGIKEVDDGIWLVSFMHYDLGYIELEQRTLQTIDNPFGTRLSPMSLGTFCHPCLRAGQAKNWSEWQDLNLRPPSPERGDRAKPC